MWFHLDPLVVVDLVYSLNSRGPSFIFPFFSADYLDGFILHFEVRKMGNTVWISSTIKEIDTQVGGEPHGQQAAPLGSSSWSDLLE